MLESDRASREREWSGALFGTTVFFTCHGGELAIGHGGRMVEGAAVRLPRRGEGARHRRSDSEARSRAGSLGGMWGPCRRILHVPNGVLHAAGLSRAQRSESVQVTSALVFGLRIGRIGSSWGALTSCTMQEVTMTELLDLTVDAHGGLARWNEVTAIQAALSITGAIWYVKGQPDVLKDIVMVADTRRERIRTSFVNDDRQSVFEPDRVVVETKDGTLVESREDPERSFEGQVQDTPWDAIHVAYFSGEALWTYLNTPFIYTQERFRTEEIGSIQADGETWRRLKVTFPEEVKSHSREQIFCIGPDGLLRRHDYTVDILGGATGLNYASEYRDVDGIVFPTKRRVYGYEGDYQIVPEPLLVGVDIGEITLS